MEIQGALEEEILVKVATPEEEAVVPEEQVHQQTLEDIDMVAMEEQDLQVHFQDRLYFMVAVEQVLFMMIQAQVVEEIQVQEVEVL